MSELALKLIKEAKEKRLTRLDLGNCGLTELPDELFELTWLEELNLGMYGDDYENVKSQRIFESKSNNQNRISGLPFKISYLTNLKKLWIVGDYGDDYQLGSLRNLGNIETLSNLILLDISNNYVSNISPLTKLINLQVLKISEIGRAHV